MEIADARETLHVRNAGLAGSTFDNVNLHAAKFTDVNLRDSRFTDVNLAGCAIQDVNLTGMTINGLLVTDLIRAYENRPTAVLYAHDLSNLKNFYQGLFDLSVEYAKPDHVVLNSPVTQLTIVQVPEAIAARIRIAQPPERRTETPIKLVFAVRDIDAAREAAARLGGGLDPMEREWTYKGYRVCDGYDPEGNVVQCRQAKTGKA